MIWVMFTENLPQSQHIVMTSCDAFIHFALIWEHPPFSYIWVSIILISPTNPSLIKQHVRTISFSSFKIIKPFSVNVTLSISHRWRWKMYFNEYSSEKPHHSLWIIWNVSWPSITESLNTRPWNIESPCVITLLVAHLCCFQPYAGLIRRREG